MNQCWVGTPLWWVRIVTSNRNFFFMNRNSNLVSTSICNVEPDPEPRCKNVFETKKKKGGD